MFPSDAAVSSGTVRNPSESSPTSPSSARSPSVRDSGRDLSGVAASYERLYRKPLVAEMRACMTFGSGASELCKLACAIVEGSPPYEA